MNNQSYFDSVIKDLIESYRDFDRKYTQDLSNVEATQRIILQDVAGIKKLVELNYQEIQKNRKETLKNRSFIDRNFETIKSIEQKIDSIVEKLDKALAI